MSASVTQKNLKSLYKVSSKLEPVYTGGKVVYSRDGAFMLCAHTNDVMVVSLISGQTISRLPGVRICE